MTKVSLGAGKFVTIISAFISLVYIKTTPISKVENHKKSDLISFNHYKSVSFSNDSLFSSPNHSIVSQHVIRFEISIKLELADLNSTRL